MEERNWAEVLEKNFQKRQSERGEGLSYYYDLGNS